MKKRGNATKESLNWILIFSMRTKKRGIYRSNVQQWPDAEEDFTEMIRINPQSKFGYKLRSVARYYQKNYPNALKDVNKVLMIDSTDCEARQTRGHAFIKWE